jgi:hypothetical protein
MRAEAPFYPSAIGMNDAFGVIRPAVERYLEHEDLTPKDMAALRSYLSGSIPAWGGGTALNRLRT